MSKLISGPAGELGTSGDLVEISQDAVVEDCRLNEPTKHGVTCEMLLWKRHCEDLAGLGWLPLDEVQQRVVRPLGTQKLEVLYVHVHRHQAEQRFRAVLDCGRSRPSDESSERIERLRGRRYEAPRRWLVAHGSTIRLANWPTRVASVLEGSIDGSEHTGRAAASLIARTFSASGHAIAEFRLSQA